MIESYGFFIFDFWDLLGIFWRRYLEKENNLEFAKLLFLFIIILICGFFWGICYLLGFIGKINFFGSTIVLVII